MKIPWYESAILRQQIVMIIVGALGLFGVATDIDWDATVSTILAAVAALVPVWTLITRLIKPAPPITETAQLREIALRTRQGGYIRPGALLTILALSFVGVACGSLGLETPQGFNERLAAGYSGVAGVRESAQIVLQARHQATLQEEDPDARRALQEAVRDDAQSVQDQADSARKALDSASALRQVDFKTAEARLTSALAVINALRQYLEEEGSP